MLPKDIRRAVEKELTNYPIRLKRLEILKEEVMNSGNRELSGMPIHHSGESVTERKALELCSSEILFLEKRCKQIREGLELLDDEERRLVELKYFCRKFTHDGVMAEMNISKRERYFITRNRILEKIAYITGMWYL